MDININRSLLLYVKNLGFDKENLVSADVCLQVNMFAAHRLNRTQVACLEAQESE